MCLFLRNRVIWLADSLLDDCFALPGLSFLCFKSLPTAVRMYFLKMGVLI